MLRRKKFIGLKKKEDVLVGIAAVEPQGMEMEDEDAMYAALNDRSRMKDTSYENPAQFTDIHNFATSSSRNAELESKKASKHQDERVYGIAQQDIEEDKLEEEESEIEAERPNAIYQDLPVMTGGF